MNTAFYTGRSGLLTFQSALDNTGNNIANTNTAGYKASKSNFASLVAQEMYINGEEKPLTGKGVKISGTSLVFAQGTPQQTYHDLDFAIVGDGMFCVSNGNTREYTRNGAFQLSVNGSNSYLTTMDGAYVLDSKGSKITIKLDKETKQPDLTGIKDKIGVYDVPNPEGLIPLSGNRYLASDTTGTIKALNSGSKNKNLPYELLSGSLELSGVSIMDEMTNMITAQRAFQLSAKVVTTADQVEEIVNNLRK